VTQRVSPPTQDMPALGKLALRAPKFPGSVVATRCLGDSVSGPSITDLRANFRFACEFFTKSPLTYAEFKQQCVSLRLFVFAGVTASCTLALALDPPKSSYWMRWSPSYWPSYLRCTFLGSASPLFPEKKASGTDVLAVAEQLMYGIPIAPAAKEVVPPAEQVPAAAAPAPVVPPAAPPAAAPAAEVAAPSAAVPAEAAPAAASQGDEAGAAESESESAQVLEAARSKHCAFVFVKPHAVCDKVLELTRDKLEAHGIVVVGEGSIPAERIDEERLIDTHYGAIAAKAVLLQPSALAVPEKAQAEFQQAFGVSWEEALKDGLVYNAMDGAGKLGITTQALGNKWGTLVKGRDLLKFGGGFYCGKIDGIYVINGFYMDMRSKFTKAGTGIHYFNVEWSPQDLSWADFRSKVLGSTDPKTADKLSLRHLIYDDWAALGLKACPNTGDNGVHASASPFEALAERANWLGVSPTKDLFGRALLVMGLEPVTLKAWYDDPLVDFEGKKQSLFDLLEDLDAAQCLERCALLGRPSAEA